MSFEKYDAQYEATEATVKKSFELPPEGVYLGWVDSAKDDTNDNGTDYIELTIKFNDRKFGTIWHNLYVDKVSQTPCRKNLSTLRTKYIFHLLYLISSALQTTLDLPCHAVRTIAKFQSYFTAMSL